MDKLTKALEAIDQIELEPVDRARTRALVKAYDAHYSDVAWNTVDVEKAVTVELQVSPWKFVGAIDTLATDESGNLAMIEHKTTSLDVSDLSSPYFSTLSYNLQISAYHLAQQLLGQPVSQTVYDVIRKPTTKPKSIPKGTEGRIGTQSEITELGTYYGHEVDIDGDTPDSESIELYELRLSYLLVHERDKYFVRYGQIRRSVNDLMDTYKFLCDIAEDINRCRERGIWHMSTASCHRPGVTCEYISLCRGVASPDSTSWEKRQGSSLSGENNLSCSRIRCFQECQRKHYWRYEYGITRRKQSSVALRVGSAFHLAMEQWWAIAQEALNER